MWKIYGHFYNETSADFIHIKPVLSESAIKQAKFFELGLNFANIVYSDEPNKIATE